jgi:hypothetical protein
MEFDWGAPDCTCKIGRLVEEKFRIPIWEFLQFFHGFKFMWISFICLKFDLTKDFEEAIPTSLPSSVDDISGRVDVQHKPDDLCTGPITRACAKLLEQQVNSLLTEYNLFTNENFILPKSLHVCMIRFMVEASITRGGEELHEDNRKMVPIISESTREEKKAGAPPLKKKSWKSFQSWLWQAEPLELKLLQISFLNSETFK